MKRCRVIRKRWKKKSNGYNASAREQFNPGSARLTRLANKFQIPAPSPLPISLDPSNLHLYSMQQSSSSHTDLLEEKGKKERKKRKKGRKVWKKFPLGLDWNMARNASSRCRGGAAGGAQYGGRTVPPPLLRRAHESETHRHTPNSVARGVTTIG